MKRVLLRILLGLLGIVLLLVLVITITLLIPVPAPPAPQVSMSPILIIGGQIVDVEKDTLLQQAVLIEGGRITAIGHPDSLEVPTTAQVVDAHGRFLIPGLWDMHVHFLPHFPLQMNLPLFFANGVTNVRELGGFTYDQKKSINQAIDANQLLGPRIQAFTGRLVTWLDSEEQAKQIVEDFQGDPADFIKVYNAVLPDYYFPMIEEAKKKGIPVLGHKPRAVSALEATKAGHKSFEHARLFLFDCYPGAEELRQAYKAVYTGEKPRSWLDNPTELREMIDTHDDSLFAELASTMVEYDAWFCPTHITRKMDAYADNDDYRKDERLKYIHFLQKQNWTKDADRMVNNDPSAEARKTYLDFYEKGLELTGKAHRLGVKVLAGTDANDTHSFPGFGLHEELEYLVKAGLSPAEALESATLLPAKYFELADSHGSISAGKVADIILLDANPLTNISNTQRISAIIFNGNIYDREKLDDALAYVENLADSWTLAVHFAWCELRG